MNHRSAGGVAMRLAVLIYSLGFAAVFLPREASAQTCSQDCVEYYCGSLWSVYNMCSTSAVEALLVYAFGNGVEAASVNGPGAFGGSSSNNGVFGKSGSSGASGIYAENLSGGYGLAGRTSWVGTAIYGDNVSSSGWAGYFTGNGYVSGYLSKAGGGFLIDHPQDPTTKVLRHSFVESPDMKNLYDGIAIVGADGTVRIQLPDYFQALNENFRYRLTTVGGFAPVFVASEVTNGAFVIGGGTPGLKVSWQVTGVRKDAWARLNRRSPEQPKIPSEKGLYLNPDAYGQPEAKRIWPNGVPPPGTRPVSSSP